MTSYQEFLARKHARIEGSMGQSYRASVTKPSYWRTAVDNMTELEAELEAPSLFDAIDLDTGVTA